jgi:nicotinamidase-related amidase
MHVYNSIKEIVDPGHTALVAWDVQNELVNRSFNKNEFLKNIKGLLALARRYKLPVVYTKITPLPGGYESSFQTYMQMKRMGITDPAKLPSTMQPGSPESEIYSEVSPLPGEVVLNKHTPSIFTGTHFEYLMRNRGITTILFSGISTETGISASARDSANRGFYTVVVSDCVSSMDGEAHQAELKILGKVCLVLSSADIVKEWA